MKYDAVREQRYSYLSHHIKWYDAKELTDLLQVVGLEETFLALGDCDHK